MKTLIVDDEFENRLLLQEILQLHGPCHLAANGKEAVVATRSALVAGAPYDLICMDITMPEMSGLEALRAIRLVEDSTVVTGAHRTKIIMVTALADRDDVITACELHCDSYLVKPVRIATLLDSLRAMKLIP